MSDWLNSVYSDGSETFVIPPHPKLGQQLKIRLQMYKDNPVEQVYLRIIPDGEEELLQMEIEHEDHVFVYFQKQITMTHQALNYRFKIVTRERVYWFNNFTIQTTYPLDAQDFRIIANLEMPSWLADRVFYQIFPDRFCCGQPKNLPDYEYQGHRPVAKQWHEYPDEYHKSFCMDFFSGDIAGISSKIDYLQNLGVNAIYLNPIFQAPSNHRYDVQDYFNIDPIFGSNQQFAEFVAQLHQSQMRIILDGVFNHSGMSCRWFNRNGYYPEPGAYQSLQSPYAECYAFIKHPNKYHAWQGVETLPKFNYLSEKLRQLIYKDKQSVMQYWLDAPYHIDGWRIDAANMLARQHDLQDYRGVWRELRSIIKQNFPDSYILGEHFFDASDLLQGDALDSSMNYQGFTFPVRKWLTGKNSQGQSNRNITTEELDEQIRLYRSTISWQIAVHQYNLLNSHDLPRLGYLVENPELQKVAAVFLLTHLGVPALLYGEEIALPSDQSVESTRIPMPWHDENRWDQEIFALYQRLIELRKNSRALQYGSIKTLHRTGDIYSYARFLGPEKIIVILNRGHKTLCSLNLRCVGIWQKSLKSVCSDRVVEVDAHGNTSFNLADYGFDILVVR